MNQIREGSERNINQEESENAATAGILQNVSENGERKTQQFQIESMV